MRTRTVIKYTRNLTDEEFKQCYKKNLGTYGQMKSQVKDFWENKSATSKVVLIKDEKSNIIAWSMTEGQHFGDKGVMFWVEKPYRRKGYGTRLLYHSKKVDPKPRVFPHDEKSGRFFKKHLSGVRVAKHDRYWLDNL